MTRIARASCSVKESDGMRGAASASDSVEDTENSENAIDALSAPAATGMMRSPESLRRSTVPATTTPASRLSETPAIGKLWLRPRAKSRRNQKP
jgi:hypothetical protein